MTMLLVMSTCTSGFYVGCILLYAFVSRCRAWRREWSSSPTNQVDAEERIQQHVAAEIEMADTGYWPNSRAQDSVRKSIL